MKSSTPQVHNAVHVMLFFDRPQVSTRTMYVPCLLCVFSFKKKLLALDILYACARMSASGSYFKPSKSLLIKIQNQILTFVPTILKLFVSYDVPNITIL